MSDTLLINEILAAASERKATEIHLLAGNNPVIRVDGRLVTLTDQQVLNPDIILALVESFLSEDDKQRLNQDREVVTIYTWAQKNRYRAKVFYQKGFLAVSLRLIPSFIKPPKELGLPMSIVQLLNKDKGLIIITGPFASGRSASAAALLETLNQNKGMHIQTLEKPIEYLFNNNQSIIEQRAVGRDVVSFSSGLKNMLDEDVDAVMVDSVHEEGVEEMILELAESGKLVIYIMDADSVISALDRFISHIDAEKKGWARELLSEVILGVIVQRLLPRIGGGMSLAYEVLTSTPAVRSSIKDGNLHQLSSIMQTSKDEGMTTLDKSLLELVRVGEVNMEDAKKQAMDPQAFR